MMPNLTSSVCVKQKFHPDVTTVLSKKIEILGSGHSKQFNADCFGILNRGGIYTVLHKPFQCSNTSHVVTA